MDLPASHQDQILSTVLISKHIKGGQPKQALKMCRDMGESGLEQSSYTIVAALKACSSFRDLESAKRIHTEVYKYGYQSNPYVCSSLVDVYVKCGKVQDAKRVFESMPRHIAKCWNAMILGYAQTEEGEQALQLYTQMKQEGVVPNAGTFVAALKACNTLAAIKGGNKIDAKLGEGLCLKLVKDIHSDVENSKFKSAVVVLTMLLDVYAKCGSIVDARRVFEEMPSRDVVAWNTIILGYAQGEDAGVALELFARMQHEGLLPNDRTFVGALKACSTLAASENINEVNRVFQTKQCLEQVRAIHAQVVKSGSESALYVGTMLVDSYAKCGSLEDARHVFNNMSHRNVVSWTAMIMGYAQMHQGGVALQLYARMRQEGVLPNRCTFLGALKACMRLEASEVETEADGEILKQHRLEQVKAIHSDIVKSGFEYDLFVGNMLVDVYARCGSLLDARHVFEKMPRRDVVSWNTMILGYAQMGEGGSALKLYARLLQERVVPDDRTYVGALKACTVLAASEVESKCEEKVVKAQCLEQVRAIHADVMNRGFGLALFVGTMLVDVYAKCGSLVEARSVFENMRVRDVVAWTAMIFGYTEVQQGEAAWQLYEAMKQDGVAPNNRTFLVALKACWNEAELTTHGGSDGMCLKGETQEKVRIIHSDIIKSGSGSDSLVGNMLVNLYARCGCLRDARGLFESMPYRDVVSWNVMISGYVQMHEIEEALKLYARMREEGVVPDDRTFIGVLRAYISLAALKGGYEADRILEQVRAIHSEMLMVGTEPAAFLWTTLVDVYARYGNLLDARQVFEKMPCRSITSWNCMIMRYAEMDEGEEALQLYARMQKEGVLPNELTFVGALKACAVVAGLEKGKEIHAQLSGLELDGDMSVSTTLIDMYGKCGSIENAQQVFDTLPVKDVVAWSVLIAAYSHLGQSEIVFDLFKRMRQEGIQPDGITFLSILKVCSHVGLVEDGQEYFQAMSKDFGIPPTIDHYTTLIDLLCRSGQMDKAMELVNMMPFQPDGAVWQTVLCACQKWSNVKLGRHAFECAVRLDKNDAAAYVLMANIYAAADMLDDAEEILALREKIPAWKKPGQSWWTGKVGIVHVFVAGDEVHPESERIHAKLQDISFKMDKDIPFLAGRGWIDSTQQSKLQMAATF